MAWGSIKLELNDREVFRRVLLSLINLDMTVQRYDRGPVTGRLSFVGSSTIDLDNGRFYIHVNIDSIKSMEVHE